MSDAQLGAVDFELRTFYENTNVTLHIEPDGKTTRRLHDGSLETLQLDQATLDSLRDTAAAVPFSTLDPSYGCGGCVDADAYGIALVLDGTTHTVAAEETSSFPEPLRALVDALRDVSALPAH